MSEPTPNATAEKAAPAGWKVKSKFLGIGLLIGVLGGLGAAGKVYMDLSGTIEELEAYRDEWVAAYEAKRDRRRKAAKKAAKTRKAKKDKAKGKAKSKKKGKKVKA